MDTDKDRSVRRFVRWLKDKVENRRGLGGDHDPWWVTLMLDVGRPAVAVMVLTMCAPGEHYLGVMAGWTSGQAWLTPGVLTAYAGISAIVATKRPKDAPGHKTAVLGAILSIGLAMAAQPVAHLYELHLITGHRFILSIVVSVIPAAVFGHLLHLGASTPKARRTAGQRTAKPDKRSSRADKVMAGADSGVVSKRQWLADNMAAAADTGQSVSALMSAPDSPPDAATWTADNRVVDSHSAEDLQETLDSIPDKPVRQVSTGSMRGHALSILRMQGADTTDDYLRDMILDKFGQDSKPNSVWRSIKRARADYEREMAS